MTTAELRLERLRKELSGGSTVRLVNGNEVHVDAAIEEIPGLCQRVRDACRGRLAMIVCSSIDVNLSASKEFLNTNQKFIALFMLINCEIWINYPSEFCVWIWMN